MDFTMSGDANFSAGLAFSVEVEAGGAKVGLGKGTKYTLAGATYTMQSGPSRKGYDDVNGTRSNF